MNALTENNDNDDNDDKESIRVKKNAVTTDKSNNKVVISKVVPKTVRSIVRCGLLGPAGEIIRFVLYKYINVPCHSISGQ